LLLAGIRGTSSLILQRNFPGVADALLFTMGRIDSAGEFQARGIKNNGCPPPAQQNLLWRRHWDRRAGAGEAWH
jgi:hypothetical protein